MNTLARTALLAALTLSPSVVAQTLLKDINAEAVPSRHHSWPHGFVSDGSTWTYFAAETPANGSELYRSDGVTLELAADVAAGTAGSYPQELFWNGWRVLFFAGVEDWPARTLYSHLPGSGTATLVGTFSQLGLATVWTGSVFFFANGGDGAGVELWASDGSAAGTRLVKDIWPGDGSSGQSSLGMLVVGGKLFFAATDNLHGTELWVSDGSTVGTVMVKDIQAGSASSAPQSFVALGGLLYFIADDGVSGPELWRSDGTAAGTSMVKNVTPDPWGSSIQGLMTRAGKLFFWADQDGDLDWDLWRSDGTAAGTVMLHAFGERPVEALTDFCPLGAKVLFRAAGQLWSADGSLVGTLPIAPLGGVDSDPFEWRCLALSSKVLWLTEGADQQELWVSDGTAAGTMQLPGIGPPGITSEQLVLAASGTEAVFAASEGVYGVEPWISDGTAAGTRLLADVNVRPPGSSLPADPQNFMDFYGQVVFAANDGVHGRHLWISDGTEAGTRMIEGPVPSSPGYSWPAPQALLGDRLLFSKDGQLWITDGTAAGTSFLAGDASGARDFVELGSEFLFVVPLSPRGDALCATDGTRNGTRIVRLFETTEVYRAVSDPARFGDRVFFGAYEDGQGYELWASDGTAAGTVRVKEFQPGFDGGAPNNLVVYDDRLFFSATDGVHGHELWVSDGTAAGTQLLFDINVGGPTSHSHLRYPTVALGKLFFWADDGVHGRELWSSDGTAVGTTMVKDINVHGDSQQVPLVEVGDQLFFRGLSELWVSDGTTAGTVMVKDIYPGGSGSMPFALTAAGEHRLFFFANGYPYGRELWQSDGTAAGTLRISDIRAGASSSVNGDSELILAGGKLFFEADDGVSFTEVWTYDPGASSKQIGRASGSTEPELSTSAALIGGTWELSIDSDIPSSFGYLALSPPARPTSLFMPNFLAQDNQIYLDLVVALSSPLIWVSTDANGDWSLSVPVPGGMSPSPLLCVQGVLVNSGKWDLTNAVHFTIGH